MFNFHRIGDPEDTPFDPNVFSSSEEQFAEQIGIISSRFRIINVSELLAISDSNQALSEPLAMITFDDGYIDNYTKAFPILKSFEVTAIFFLVTNFLSEQGIPWWDEVAWIIRNSCQDSVNLPGLRQPIQIDRNDLPRSIRTVLRYFKDIEEPSLSKKIELVNKINSFSQKSVGEYVISHHEYFKENVNYNKSDCCNLRFIN